MKKLITLLFVALLCATGANAQREIPLTLGGGGNWNAGFVGDADVYSYTMNAIYGAAEFACNVSSAEYPKYIVEFEEPLPENFQINYVYKESAEAEATIPVYGRAVGDGNKTKFELSFDYTHPYITMVAVQHTNDVSASIKIKKLTLVSANEENNLYIVPQFTNWAGTDNSEYYSGTVTFDQQYQQLNLNGVNGKKGVTINVKFADSNPNIQLCIDYEGKDVHEWPYIDGSCDFTFTTKAEAALTHVGIQMRQENPIDPSVQKVTVNSATASYTDPTSAAVANEGSSDYWGTYSNNLTAVKLSDDVEVYNVTLSDEKDMLTFTKRANNKVAKGEGVIVKSKSASFGVEVIDEDLTKAEENLLKATPTTEQVIDGGSDTLYKLTYKKDAKTGLGFYWGSEDGKSMKAIPGKAYLAIPSSETMSLRKSIVIGDSETTSIIGPKAERVNQGAIHNLAGQRVNRLTKGVNIIGNNKVFVK